MRRPGSPTAPTSPLSLPSSPTAGRSALWAASGALGALGAVSRPVAYSRPTWTVEALCGWLEKFPGVHEVYLGLHGECVALHGIERITTDKGLPALLLRPREE